MATHAHVLRAVRKQFEKASGIRLAGGTNKRFHSIYTATLRRFVSKGRKAGIDVWKSKPFRRWVLLETTKIGRDARRRAGASAMTADDLKVSAVKVMRAAKQKYRVWMPATGFPLHKRGIPLEECDLCAPFLKRFK